ncbi:hypothetical protein [Halomicronema sp. CCY15110]|uniref:hypothetical protein n=1 Tax=Halomicronema sp. CCY15110 TaxID=2767773 RepID=UPI0019520374|nr:hypothetical protein [Halomicronema sp. CCY15110]
MKLPNSPRNARREVDHVVGKVFKTIESANARDKETFERLLDGIIVQVAKNRRLDVNQVAVATDQVIAAMPDEYGRLEEELRGWETLIAFLYIKYHQVLGIDPSIFQG